MDTRTHLTLTRRPDLGVLGATPDSPVHPTHALARLEDAVVIPKLSQFVSDSQS